ncbi:MAG TPA: PKD domain-containing protein [Candidatus Thermoplasmatota archaeon]|nr:PKD domain-containing protein [Candidatus Thermoplasmatota archaeon]
MMHRLASLGAGLALLALATAGCFTQPDEGVFGPANSLGGAENDSPALSLQASPARGPGPLQVEFSLSALDRDGGPLTWSLDFGDRTAPAAGGDLPAKPRHTYAAPGAYVARFQVEESGGESFVSTISLVVLEGAVPEQTTTQGPEEPEYSPPPSGGGGGSSASQTTTNASSNSTSVTSTSTGPGGNSSANETSSSTSTSEEPPSSETSSSSDTGTSSSTGTETFSDPGTSTSETSTSTAPPPDPEPTTSESETSSSDPPL